MGNHRARKLVCTESNLKLMFDRLVCMNGGNPREATIKHKDPELAMKLEHSAEWQEMSLNHLEGRTAGFFCYGDGGGNELDSTGRPKLLEDEHKHYFDPQREPFTNEHDSYAPLVWQCRYGGIEVPDDLWQHVEFGKNEVYSDNQTEDLSRHNNVFLQLDDWTDRFAEFVRAKGKVRPGKYPAFGYQPPGHFLYDVRLAWRDIRMRFGNPRINSSPARQQTLGWNRDVTKHPKKSEGEKLRER